MFRVDYLGYQFWTDVYGVPDTLNDTFQIPHQDVAVTINAVYGNDSEPMENIKAYLFTASGAYMGESANTDPQGRVIFSLPEKDYMVRADYLGSRYWSEVIAGQDEDIDIDHGKVNIHITDLGEDIENAKVYLFTETGTYLGKYENTDSSGSASFTLPVELYKFRVDYNGSQYWSGEITPLPHEELNIDLALDLLALNCCQQIELSGFVTNELSAFPLPNPEKDIADTELKRRWGMARTEPIESGVEAVPHRSAFTSAISGWARSTSFIFIDTFRF
jgi:hypothetical protein